MVKEINECVSEVAEKASKAVSASETLHYSQAALNLAHTVSVVIQNKRDAGK